MIDPRQTFSSAPQPRLGKPRFIRIPRPWWARLADFLLRRQ